MRHEPEFEELMAWFRAEKESGTLEVDLFKVMDTVISGRRYSEDQKIGMISRKATSAYNFAKQKIYSDPDSAMRGLRESLLLHLRAFKMNATTGSPMLQVSEKYARNTADQWIRLVADLGKWEPLVEIPSLERDSDGYLDPISSPFISYLDAIAQKAYFQAEKSRISGAAKKLISHSFDKGKWMDTTVVPDILKKLNFLAEVLKK
jgi:hypothetical protein